MRFLFVLEHFHPYIGGAEHLFFELTKALVGKGHRVTVITTLHHQSLAKEETINGVKIVRVNCCNRYLFTLLSIPVILREAPQCDVIHTTTYTAALPARLAGKIVGKPVIITFHEFWGSLWLTLPFIKGWQKRLYQWFEQLLIRLAFHRYIAVSHYTRDCLLQAGASSERITTIYNGLDYAAFPTREHVPPSIFTYTYFGRLGISKGLDVLLPAAKQFSTDYPETRLQLIIPRQPKSIFIEIQKLIKKLELQKHLTLYHNLPQKELQEVLKRSSCIVIPSYSEGFCFAAGEAVALNIPIVSSQKGALKEVVSGKYLPVEPLEVKTLYQALVKASEGDWKEVPTKKFPLEHTIEQYLKMYENLSGKRGKI